MIPEFATKLDQKQQTMKTLKEQIEEVVAQEAKKKVEVETEIREKPETPRETPKETPSVATPTDSPKVKEGKDSEEIETVKVRISKLEKDVMNLHEKVETTHMVETANLENLATKVQEMQGDVEKLTQTTDTLLDERETREMNFNVSIFDHLLLIILKNLFLYLLRY